MNELIKAENIKTMTSTEISNLLGKEKKEINREIKSMFADKIVGGDFSPTLRPNGQVAEYHLPELESKMFVAKQDINYLEKITQFWIDQNKTPALPDFTNPAAAARAYADQWEKAEQLKIDNARQSVKILADKPKVIFADSVAASKTSILIGAMAKLINQNGTPMGQNRLFKWMREHGYIMNRIGSKREPTQRSLDLGVLEKKEGTYIKPNGTIIITSTTVVTGKGQMYFMKKLVD